LRHDNKEFRLSLFQKPSKDEKPILIDRLTMEPEIALMLFYAFKRNVREYEAMNGRIKPRTVCGKISEQFTMLVETRG